MTDKSRRAAKPSRPQELIKEGRSLPPTDLKIAMPQNVKPPNIRTTVEAPDEITITVNRGTDPVLITGDPEVVAAVVRALTRVLAGLAEDAS